MVDESFRPSEEPSLEAILARISATVEEGVNEALDAQRRAYEVRIEDLEKRLHNAEKRATHSVDTLETVQHPALRINGEQIIERMNDLAKTRFGYSLAEIEGESIFNYIGQDELGILHLFSAYDSLREFITYEDMEDFPVTFRTSEGKQLPYSVQLRFFARASPGYHGATVVFMPRARHFIDRIMPRSVNVLKAAEFMSKEGLIDYKAKTETGVFGNLVIAPFTSDQKGRTRLTIVDMEGVQTCGDEIYQFLANTQSKLHATDPRFDIQVYTSSPTIRQELIKQGFPEQNIKDQKKKNKEKK